MSLVERLAAEWTVISNAPYSFFLTILSIFLLAVAGVSLWYRRELSATKAEKNSADAVAKLAEKQRDTYKTEAENYRKKLAKAGDIQAPTQLAPVVYGNTAVQDAYASVSTSPFPNRLTLTAGELDKVAAFMRLRDAGLANIESNPYSLIVTGTNTATELRPEYDKWKEERRRMVRGVEGSAESED